MSTEINAKKKLSPKTVVGDIKKMVKDGTIKSGQAIYRAMGIADSFRSGETNYGPWTAFLGDFEYTNMLTGEVFRGSQAFFDATFTEALMNKMRAADGQAIEFALECSVDISDDYPTGFAYVARPILDGAHNRLEGLRNRLAALPAPESAKADKPAPKGGKKAE